MPATSAKVEELTGNLRAVVRRVGFSGEAHGQSFLLNPHGPAAADLIASLNAEVERLREALTPSGDTKAAYIGEFSFGITRTGEDDEGDPCEFTETVPVPWTTIKEIMAAIAARAALSALES